MALVRSQTGRNCIKLLAYNGRHETKLITKCDANETKKSCKEIQFSAARRFTFRALPSLKKRFALDSEHKPKGKVEEYSNDDCTQAADKEWNVCEIEVLSIEGAHSWMTSRFINRLIRLAWPGFRHIVLHVLFAAEKKRRNKPSGPPSIGTFCFIIFGSLTWKNDHKAPNICYWISRSFNIFWSQLFAWNISRRVQSRRRKGERWVGELY